MSKPLNEKRRRIDPASCSTLETSLVFGVSKQALGGWIKAGCPVLPDGRFDLPSVVRWKIDRVSQDSDELEAEKIRKTRADATLAEMKIAEACERLVERDIIIRAVRASITATVKILQDCDKSLARFVPEDARQRFMLEAGRWVKDMVETLRQCEAAIEK